jgi:hypothetical protein
MSSPLDPSTPVTRRPDRTETLGATTLLGRGAQPDGIGEVVAFLEAPKASYIAGAVIAVNGVVRRCDSPDQAESVLRFSISGRKRTAFPPRHSRIAGVGRRLEMIALAPTGRRWIVVSRLRARRQAP